MTITGRGLVAATAFATLVPVAVGSALAQSFNPADLLQAGTLPKLVASSARAGERRLAFPQLRQMLAGDEQYLLMLGTGWGMSEQLIQRADYFLEPIRGGGEYNHLSVRSACAIMLDRLLGQHD